jgi:ATP-dependent DNA ligase
LPPHIETELRRFPAGVYDGELVASSGKAWDVVTASAQLVFVVFDVLAVKGRDVTADTYLERRQRLMEVLARLPFDQTAISTVESVTPSWKLVEGIWARGGEGVILKHIASTYRPGMRSTQWIKVKQQHAATLTITGYKPGKSGPYSTLALTDARGHVTTVKMPDTATWRAITKDPDAFLGKRVVISYQELTPAGAYRHGIFDHFAGKGE